MNPYLRMPNILKETSDGLSRYSIQEEMLMRREIDVIGEITQEYVYLLILQLRYLQTTEPKKEITIYINSQGGEVTSGLALYDVMKAIKSPIKTVCVGQASSMGALLFISGNKREMLPHSRVMIHDPRVERIGGTALEIEEHSKDIMRVRKLIAKIIADHTNKTVDEVLEKTSTDCYFDATEAIDFGIADTVIDKI